MFPVHLFPDGSGGGDDGVDDVVVVVADDDDVVLDPAKLEADHSEKDCQEFSELMTMGTLVRIWIEI